AHGPSRATAPSSKPGGGYIPTMTRLFPLVLLSAACSGLGLNLREPDIQLDRAVVRGVDLSGGNLDLVVKVGNPNNFTLQGTKLQVGVDVEGSHLGDVTYDNDLVVSENGQT